MASFATSSPRARVALLGLALASCAIFRSPTPQVKGRFLMPEVRPRVDDVLTRPYTPDVPFASTGDRLWATSPQGLAFDDGIHFLYVSNFVPFRVRVPGFRAGAATSTVSHVHVDAEAGNTVSASASFTYSADGADRPLAKPFEPSKRWTCWSSGRREDWYALELGGNAVVKGVTLFFFDDEAAKGACRAPERVRLERWSDGAWEPIANVESDHDEPVAGENRFTFAPVETDRLRFVFHHRGERFYTGLYGVVPVFEKPPVAPDVPPLKIAADKFLTADDVAVVVVTAKNEGFEPATLEVQAEIPWSNDKHTPGSPVRGTVKLHGLDVALAFDGAVVGDGRARVLKVQVAPGAERRIVVACAMDLDARAAQEHLDRWSLGRDPLALQVQESQRWFDTNVATFECSDPLVTKAFWHRASLLRKNFMWPRAGVLARRCCAEGRWRSTWYQNVISYGAGHQVREARWLADPSYAWGQLLTWAENPRPDGVYPSHVTPDGQKGGQYTDWISSTALDVNAVHPDLDALASHVDALDRNADAWLRVYDLDGDALPAVDSHWWTGMEWQPSFFFFENFQPDEGKGKEAELERVDLAAYAYGDAVNVAACARLVNREDVAARAQQRADRIKASVEAKLWNEEASFFFSNRSSDDAPAKVKEVVGVYPFYFGLPTAGRGFEAAWSAIVDPKEFWGPWPVRSCSALCPAYDPGRFWPVGRNVASACMWNGPTWPHANSIVLTAMARTLRDYPPCAVTKRLLLQLFESFTRAQFRGQDASQPWTGEYYNAKTGEWLTAERDYNHSTYLDVLIPDLVGLRPRNDNVLEIDPLVPDASGGGWSFFVLDGQRYRGHTVTIAWDAPGGTKRFPAMREGMNVFVDRRLVAWRADLGKVLVDLSTLRRLPLPAAR